MNRRFLCLVLVVVLTPVGVGLPRFVHMMTEHVPAAAAMLTSGREARLSHGCTHSCCAFHRSVPATPASAETEGADDANEPLESDQPHHCPVCQMLATLLTSVPVLPAASVAWQPIVERAAEFPAAPMRAIYFDPHAPRGPPASA